MLGLKLDLQATLKFLKTGSISHTFKASEIRFFLNALLIQNFVVNTLRDLSSC